MTFILGSNSLQQQSAKTEHGIYSRCPWLTRGKQLDVNINQMGEEGPSFSYLQIEKIRSFLHGCLCQHAMASPRAGIDLYPFMAVSFNFLRFGCVMSVWHGLMVVGQETCVCILITPFGIDGSLNPLLKSASISILGMKCRRLNLLQYPFE